MMTAPNICVRESVTTKANSSHQHNNLSSPQHISSEAEIRSIENLEVSCELNPLSGLNLSLGIWANTPGVVTAIVAGNTKACNCALLNK